MYPKNFFPTLNRAKCAKCVSVISGVFLIFSLFFVTGTISGEESAQPASASDKLDQTVRFILQNSIRTIQEARNYSAYLYCQAKILGKSFNGRGEYYQKREIETMKMEETVSSRWEITFYKYPERFSEETNGYLSCARCTEKLCAHKNQLKSLWAQVAAFTEQRLRRLR